MKTLNVDLRIFYPIIYKRKILIILSKKIDRKEATFNFRNVNVTLKSNNYYLPI